jgi:hypothetical protein
MTAVRIIDDHSELENIGSLSHEQLDQYVTGSAFLVVSGSRPPSARQLVAGVGVTIIDGGPGGDLTVSAISGLTPTSIGQLLFAATPEKFSVALPIISVTTGWLINESGLLLVSASI